MSAARRTPRLVGGVHRDLGNPGHASDPLQFYVSIDRGLASGKLDNVEVDEMQILRLAETATTALRMIQERRRAEAAR